MQPDREKEATIKEKINRPIAFRWCAHCNKTIPVFSRTERRHHVCPLCKRPTVIIGKATRKEWFGK